MLVIWMKISRISDFMILNIYYTYINVYVWYTKSVLIRTPLFWGGFPTSITSRARIYKIKMGIDRIEIKIELFGSCVRW